MSARIDHAAEANEWIGDAPPALHGTNGETQNPTRAIVCALLAQAEATLALVEQQRIANLITLATLSGEYDENTDLLRIEAVASLVKWVPHGPDDEHPEIRPNIAAALRIDGDAS